MRRPYVRAPLRVLALLFVLGIGACGEGEGLPGSGTPGDEVRPAGNGTNRNVLLITIDTIRADRLGAYGHPGGASPALDGLARDGVVFATAYSPVPLTLPAHTSLMTGTYPMVHGVRDNVGYTVPPTVETLAERFAAAGYRTGAFVSSFVLDSRWGLDQGFEHYHDGFEVGGGLQPMGGGQAGLEHTADVTVARALAWLRDADDRPFFLWVHLFDPHTPYDAPSPYGERFAADPYLGEIAFTDAQVGELLERMGEMGLRDETVVAVAGDHGEGLGEHGEVQHGLFVYEESLRVPMILAAPGRVPRGLRRTEPVSLVDLAPTLAELVDVTFETDQGVSLVPAMDPDHEAPPRYVYAESLYGQLHYGWSGLTAVVGDRYKLIESPDPELYDLAADPDEEANRAAELNTVYLDLSRRLARIVASEAGAHAAVTGPVDADTQARLQALGYVGSIRQPVDDDGAARPSPRSRIDVYNRVLDARAAMKAGAMADAERLLAGAVAEEPGMLEAQRLLGQVYSATGRPAEAAAVYRAAVPLNPTDPLSYLLLADALTAAGELTGAGRVLEDGLELVGESADLLVTLGSVRAQAGDLAAAAAAFDAALAIDSELAHAHSGLAQVRAGLGDLDAAAVHARRALDLDPDMPRAHFLLAEAARRDGDIELAITEYRAELANQPGNLVARVNLAMSYRQQGRTDEELAALEEAVRLAPEAAPGNLMLARVLIEQDTRLDYAAQLLTRTLERPLDDGERLIGFALMAAVSERVGDEAAAARWARLRDELAARIEGGA